MLNFSDGYKVTTNANATTNGLVKPSNGSVKPSNGLVKPSNVD